MPRHKKRYMPVPAPAPTPAPALPEPYLTAQQVADRLPPIKVTTVYEWTRRREKNPIPHYSAWLVSPQAIQAFIREQEKAE